LGGACQYIRLGDTAGSVGQIRGTATPLDGGARAQTEGRLVVNVDSTGSVGSGDDIDVVAWVGRGRFDSRRHGETRESLPVAIDGIVNPITNWHGWASVRIGLVDDWLRNSNSVDSSGGEGREQGRGALHGEEQRGEN
jgi:hypothetical protein